MATQSFALIYFDRDRLGDSEDYTINLEARFIGAKSVEDAVRHLLFSEEGVKFLEEFLALDDGGSSIPDDEEADEFYHSRFPVFDRHLKEKTQEKAFKAFLDHYRLHVAQFIKDMEKTWQKKSYYAFSIIDESEKLFRMVHKTALVDEGGARIFDLRDTSA